MSVQFFKKYGFRFGTELKSKEEREKEEHFFHQLYRFVVMTIILTLLFIVL
jgi:hypothetical protein